MQHIQFQNESGDTITANVVSIGALKTGSGCRIFFGEKGVANVTQATYDAIINFLNPQPLNIGKSALPMTSPAPDGADNLTAP